MRQHLPGGPRPPHARQLRRTHYPNLSPTRPPAVEADQGVWSQAWCNEPIEQLGMLLVDEDGAPVLRGGR